MLTTVPDAIRPVLISMDVNSTEKMGAANRGSAVIELLTARIETNSRISLEFLPEEGKMKADRSRSSRGV
jgi:hypothetical protein